MAFEVRTTVLGEGNSLTSLEYADEYFDDRSSALWTGTDAAKQGALIRATDYIDGRFSARYKDEVLDATEIPIKLQRACCEYAVRALNSSLAPDPSIDASGYSVVNTHKKLGPLEKDFQVVGSMSIKMFKPYPAADMLIAPFLKPSSNQVIR